jgi:DNA-binding HxlR family transcriptional regulator
MDEDAVQYYLDQVPSEIREAVMELDNHQKWAIYIALTVEGDKYFNQLKKEFKANPNTIDKILKSLVASGLIAKKVKHIVDIGDTNKIYYTSTKFGNKFLASLYDVVLPPLAVSEIQTRPVIIAPVPGRRKERIPIPKQNLKFPLPEPYQPLELVLEGAQT